MRLYTGDELEDHNVGRTLTGIDPNHGRPRAVR
jgi:hypothetical protein